MPRPRAQELAAGAAEPSEAVRSRVESSRCRAPVEWAPAAEALLDRAVERVPLSGRGRARTRRVAQTLGALVGAERVETSQVAEALSYRVPRELESS
jgi:magnesium chelatase family protein